MSAKFTPGPWRITRHRNVVGLVNGVDEVVCSLGDMPCVGGHGDIAAERGAAMEEANARLIASAPDLLEALTALCNHDGEYRDGSATDLWERAHTAIAKATGGSHA